jgi:transposase
LEKQAEYIRRLEQRIEELERAAHRQGAPFRIEEGKKKQEKKRPGSKEGHKGSYRSLPKSIDETIEVKLDSCPNCGNKIEHLRAIEQYIEELPEIRPKVYKLITWAGKCSRCSKQVQSKHPLKCSEATGAAKVQTGPQAKAIAMRLQYEYGLSKRKSVDLLENLFGLSLSAGGLVYASHRMSKRCENEYNEMLADIRQSSHIHSDETSWYMGGPKSWLWVFTNERITFYKVADNRSRNIIEQVVGKDYPGVLISDCLSIYDDATAIQHKCYAHHLKAIRQAIEQLPEDETTYLSMLSILLKAAMALKQAKSGMTLHQYNACCRALEQKADALLQASRDGPLEEKVANRLRKQRDHLFTFLYHDDVDATNNQAERQLRPAVISRKISCGNKTVNGAHTWEVLTSLHVTNGQLNRNNLHFFAQKARVA